jgi:trans-aconitate 2-methyltransferase
MASGTWDPSQYERFKDERSRPFFDLLELVRAKPGMRVVDLGCGTGELTAQLHRALKASSTLGVDSSAAMLEKAQAYAEPGLRFEMGDLRALRESALDLVFSNAALHWVDGHEQLLLNFAAMLGPGGQIALQMPANTDHPAYQIADSVAQEQVFSEALGGFRVRFGVLAPERYSVLLARSGFEEQSVRLQVYLHRLESSEGVVEWVKGSFFTAYRQRLSPELYDQFVERFRARVRSELDQSRPYLYTFKRLLVWGQKGGAVG